MNYATINIKLRPIKIAFMIPYGDKKALIEAIELNTLLWGGIYNPIIPIYKKCPKSFLSSDPFLAYYTKESYVEGYFDRFDPDYIVLLGNLKREDVDIQERKFLTASDILSSEEEVFYGIDIFHILRNFYEKEVKFVRKYPIKVISPQYSKTYGLFMAAVFGQLPNKIREYYESWEKEFDATKEHITIENFFKILSTNKLFLRRFNSLNLEAYGIDQFDRNTIFVMNPKNSMDVLDYWNLRALGRNVLPAVVNDIDNPELLEDIGHFIDSNRITPRYNPHITYDPIIVRSRSSTDAQFNKAVENIKKEMGKYENKQLHINPHYPSLWRKRMKHGPRNALPTLESKKYEITLSDSNLETRVSSVAPDFVGDLEYSEQPRYANRIEFNIFSSDELKAEVLPHTNFNRSIYSSLTLIGLDKARLANNGLVMLHSTLNETVHLQIPNAKDVLFSWMKSQNIRAKISKPGKITYQLLKNLGSNYGLDFIADGELLKLLNEMGKGNGFWKYSTLKKGLYEVSKKSKAILPISSQGLLNRLIEAKAVELGLEMECPICSRLTWFPIKGISEKLTCTNCLGEYTLPTEDPTRTLHWSYKIIGPFALKGQAQGSYSVLLTMRFFKEIFRSKITPAFNFLYKAPNAKKENEIDLGMLVEDRGFSNSGIFPIFAECKSFKKVFTEKDVAKTIQLINKIPNAIAVFSTLREKLTPAEKNRLSKRILAMYKQRLRGKYHDIIILTGTELFSKDSLRESWEQATPQHKKLADGASYADLETLAEYTRELYLETPSYNEWIDKNKTTLFKKGRRIKKRSQ